MSRVATAAPIVPPITFAVGAPVSVFGDTIVPPLAIPPDTVAMNFSDLARQHRAAEGAGQGATFSISPLVNKRPSPTSDENAETLKSTGNASEQNACQFLVNSVSCGLFRTYKEFAST
jgi:hypothetical protein